MCFEVLGFDFMIDANGKSYLLEINHTPSFTTDTPLDELVKSNLIRDTLTLMNINAKARDKMLGEIKTEN
jgi:tubulin polyglutamylase TTLL6/13